MVVPPPPPPNIRPESVECVCKTNGKSSPKAREGLTGTNAFLDSVFLIADLAQEYDGAANFVSELRVNPECSY